MQQLEREALACVRIGEFGAQTSADMWGSIEL